MEGQVLPSCGGEKNVLVTRTTPGLGHRTNVGASLSRSVLGFICPLHLCWDHQNLLSFPNLDHHHNHAIAPPCTAACLWRPQSCCSAKAVVNPAV